MPSETPGSSSTATPIPLIKTPGGKPIRLYNSLVGYSNVPIADSLEDRGFSRVYVWHGASPNSSWLTETPPQSPLQDGSMQEEDIRKQVDILCSQYVDPVVQTLLVLDVEWPLFYEKRAPGLGVAHVVYSVNALNAGNLITVLRWMRTELLKTRCAGSVKVAMYQMTFSAPPLFAVHSYNGLSAASWRALNQQLAAMFAPYVDALMPSLYASWSPDQTDAYVLNWVNASTETLSEASSAASTYKLPLIPFLGMRYYADATIKDGACSSGPYQGKFVDAPFFLRMLQLVATTFSVDGIVYWDWGGYGGPVPKDKGGHALICTANDGSNVWSTSVPWYAATFSYFVTPAR